MKKTIIFSFAAFFLFILAVPQPTISLTSAVVRVTAYCHSGRTASGIRVQEGILALSRDLEYQLGMRFGDLVKLDGLGTFAFEDRMASYKRRQADIWVPRYAEARRFGVRHNVMLVKIL
jgi:3D (Asp-Asp-Asp) domain-containing protein